MGFDGFFSNRDYWPRDAKIKHPGEIKNTVPVYKMESYTEIASTMLERPPEAMKPVLEISEELQDIEYLTETLRLLLTPDQLNEILIEDSAITFLWGIVFGSTYVGVYEEEEEFSSEGI